jgi:hypothetical protein
MGKAYPTTVLLSLLVAVLLHSLARAQSQPPTKPFHFLVTPIRCSLKNRSNCYNFGIINQCVFIAINAFPPSILDAPGGGDQDDEQARCAAVYKKPWRNSILGGKEGFAEQFDAVVTLPPLCQVGEKKEETMTFNLVNGDKRNGTDTWTFAPMTSNSGETQGSLGTCEHAKDAKIPICKVEGTNCTSTESPLGCWFAEEYWHGDCNVSD